VAVAYITANRRFLPRFPEEFSMAANKKIFTAALFTLAFSLWAGDSASFVDLGFSPDGGNYMFVQYGVRTGSLRPWADIFIVDVARNSFVPDGKVSYVHDYPVAAGQDGSGALYHIIAGNAALANRYNISFFRQGQPLYVAMENGAAETIEFRNFENGDVYRALLVPAVEGTGPSLQSSFYISLEINGPGGRRTRTIGNPHIKRPQITSYRIYKVMTAPGNGAIVFVIEMRRQTADGFDTRYMVETTRL
jgi:predicted secreted protein